MAALLFFRLQTEGSDRRAVTYPHVAYGLLGLLVGLAGRKAKRVTVFTHAGIKHQFTDLAGIVKLWLGRASVT